MNKDIQKCDSCLSAWKFEEETGTFILLWYDCNQLLQSLRKRRRTSEHKRAKLKKQVLLIMPDRSD